MEGEGWLLGRRSTMVVTLQNHSGIHKSTSCLNTAKPWHTLFVLFSKAPPPIVQSVQKGAVRRLHRLGFRSGPCL